uniref:Glycosyltransferase n=1 Tax=candidate division WWE3 bacterium TaxID=2053526 RepID=A0A832DUX3_UNCKA
MARRKLIDCFVSVVVPLGRDDLDVKSFIRETGRILNGNYTNFEIILVLGVPTGEVLRQARELVRTEPCLRVIRLSRWYGLETTVFAGLDAAIGDYTVVLLPQMDSPRLVAPVVENLRKEAEIVRGVSKLPLKLASWARAGSCLFHWYVKHYLGFDVPRNSTYLLGLNRRVVNALARTKTRYRHVRYLSAQLGFESEDFVYEPNPAGFPQTGLLDSINLALEIAISFSSHPLRFLSWLGLSGASLNLLYGIYVIGIFLFKKNIEEGWTTLSLQISGLFFLVFLILTILSEYVGRILEEVRDQPSYHVIEEFSSSVSIADENRRNVLKKS